MSEQNGTEKKTAVPAWQIERLQAKDAARLQRLAWQCYPPYYDYLWQPGAMEAYLTEAFDETLLAAELADGLPAVVPTRARLASMLAGRDPDLLEPIVCAPAVLNDDIAAARDASNPALPASARACACSRGSACATAGMSRVIFICFLP